jgi:uncharacterized RDD family membrane protein YckC
MRSCDYCHHDNSDAEHRCRRCGRRLGEAANQYAASRTSPVRHLALETAPADGPVTTAEEPARRPIQKPLFSNHVVRFEDIDPTTRKRRARSRAPRKPGLRRIAPTAQQSFEFIAPAEQDLLPAAEHRTHVEPAHGSDVPAATLVRRMAATALDMGLILVAMGAFLTVPYLWNGGLPFDSMALTVYAGAAMTFLALYKLFWCMGNTDSPGMRWSGLRLIHFDGRRPSRDQRLHRLLGGCLSVGALGLGLFWAVGDQDKLTWHDHMSRTYPSPRPGVD